MNRIAEKVVGVMNDDELDALIMTNYQNDAQTLTTGTESNLLKFKELTLQLTPAEAARWEDIKRVYCRNVQLRGVGDDAKFGQVILQLTNFAESLDVIKNSLKSGVAWMIEGGPSAGREDAPVKTSFDIQTLDAMKQMVHELKAGLTQRTPPQTPAPPQPEIRLVNRVPSALLEVLRQQFKLMQGWLRPVHDKTLEHSAEIQQLREVLDNNFAAYNELIKQLKKAADEDKPE
jgi:hypothetical protein